MNSSNSYYSKIYQKFQNKSQILCNEQPQDTTYHPIDFDNTSDSEMDEHYYQYYNDLFFNKREAKWLRKIHNRVVDSYADEISHLSKKTRDSYANIVSRFILYSPSIYQKDLEPFLNEGFQLTKNGGTCKFKLKGTHKKYYLCLKRFLEHTYSGYLSNLDVDYSSSIESKEKITENEITPLKIVNAYFELMEKESIEDAIILHLIYSLEINPSTLSLLTFDSITKSKKITYYDTKLSCYITKKINDHLLRDITFFEKYKKANNIVNKQEKRSYLDKIQISGNFIITLTSSGIFKRFARGFNNKLAWFNCKPSSILNITRIVKSSKRYIGSNESLNLFEDSCIFAN